MPILRALTFVESWFLRLLLYSSLRISILLISVFWSANDQNLCNTLRDTWKCEGRVDRNTCRDKRRHLSLCVGKSMTGCLYRNTGKETRPRTFNSTQRFLSNHGHDLGEKHGACLSLRFWEFWDSYKELAASLCS